MQDITYSQGSRSTSDSSAEQRIKIGATTLRKRKRKVLKNKLSKY